MLNLDKKKHYLLACSFGPDSMALFDMLIKEKYHFEVAHVNYHLREESNDEYNALRRYCDSKDIKLHYYENNMKITRNIEEIAREIRYSFFKKLVQTYNFDALLVAHNLDDLLETYLLQKERKIIPMFYGLNSVSVMGKMKVMRPLLDIRKNSLLAYCDSNKIPYSVDKTNLLNIYRRNYYRNEVISKMNDVQIESLLKEIDTKNDELKLMHENVMKINIHDEASLLALSDTELAIAINQLIKEKLPSFDVSKKFVLEFKKCLLSSKPNISIKLDNVFDLVDEYGAVYVIESKFQPYLYKIVGPMKLDTSYFYIDFTGDTSNRNISEKDYPLVIRNADPKDKYMVNGYSVEVRRLFIDWKMPISFRKTWPVILNKDNEVIYIPRYQKDFEIDPKTNMFVKTTY